MSGFSPGEGAAAGFGHLARMADDTGIFEHAEGAIPRREHGYCTDDIARVLLVAAREAEPTPDVQRLALISLGYLRAAQRSDGSFRNRLSFDRRWSSRGESDDATGRAVWALGVASSSSPVSWIRESAAMLFARAATFHSPHSRAAAPAVIGAAAVDSRSARELVRRLVPSLSHGVDGTESVHSEDRFWPWPEPRLRYANALIPHALIAAGASLDDDRLVDRGLSLLGWLADTETVIDPETGVTRLSVTPTHGRGRGDPRPAFDQQPIEVSSLAEAAACAHEVTGASRWLDLVVLANQWFDGSNDIGVPMQNSASGGGHDGLMASGRNPNQGTESTVAVVSTRQLGRFVGTPIAETAPARLQATS